MECRHQGCIDNTNSLIRKLRAAEERIKHYRHAALYLAEDDRQKLRHALDQTIDKL